MADYLGTYSAARERFADIVLQADEGQLAGIVPACPEWTVKELLAHVVGVASDSAAGEIKGIGDNDWTSRQVAERRGKPVPELIAEWEQIAAQIEPLLNTIHPALAGGLIGDIVTHEQDLRGAVNRPGARDVATLELAIYTYVRFFGTRVKKAGLDAVEIRTDDLEWVAGAGEPGVVVEAEPFELLRSLTGRRTRAEVCDLRWKGDPEPYLDVFANYNYTRVPLNESEAFDRITDRRLSLP